MQKLVTNTVETFTLEELKKEDSLVGVKNGIVHLFIKLAPNKYSFVSVKEADLYVESVTSFPTMLAAVEQFVRDGGEVYRFENATEKFSFVAELA
jgi:hypothetical protein